MQGVDVVFNDSAHHGLSWPKVVASICPQRDNIARFSHATMAGACWNTGKKGNVLKTKIFFTRKSTSFNNKKIRY
jgi:hypothetical protein